MVTPKLLVKEKETELSQSPKFSSGEPGVCCTSIISQYEVLAWKVKDELAVAVVLPLVLSWDSVKSVNWEVPTVPSAFRLKMANDSPVARPKLACAKTTSVRSMGVEPI